MILIIIIPESPRDESYDDFSLNQIVYVGRYLRNQIGERSVGKRATRRHRHPLGRPNVCRYFKEFPWTRGRDMSKFVTFVETSMIVIKYRWNPIRYTTLRKKVKFPLKTRLETFLRELNVVAFRTGLLFFRFPGERRQTRGVSEGRSAFFSRSILRACLRSPGKGKSLIYAVAVWRIGWQ